MKKLMKIVSVFLLLFTIVSNFYILDGNKAMAYAYSPNLSDELQKVYEEKGSNGDSVGQVFINVKGQITINYKYGYSELLVVATSCSQYYNSEGTETTDKEEIKETDQCGSFDNGITHVIHLSGSYNENVDEWAEKNIYLENYFQYYEIVKIQFITSFIKVEYDNKKTQIDTTDPYYPLYCNEEIGILGCDPTPGDNISANDRTARKRVENFMESKSIPINNNIYMLDKGQLIYKNNMNSAPTDYVVLSMNSIPIVKIDESKTGEVTRNIEEKIYENIIPALILVLIIIASVTIAVLGTKIVKSSDEPQERQDAVSRLRSILIGIAIALFLLFAIEPAIKFIREYL